MNHRLLFLILVVTRISAYKLTDFITLAAKENDKDLMLQLGRIINKSDLRGFSEKAIKQHFATVDNFFKQVNNKAPDAGGGAQALSQEQYEKLKKELQLPDIPNITSKEQAKTELVNFFEKGTGDKLLTEIYGVQSPKKAIVDALKTAAPAA